MVQITMVLFLVNTTVSIKCVFCRCFTQGYQLPIFFCADNNECLEANGGCSQICSYTVGSFECKCYNGFQLGGDGRSCLGKNSSLIVHNNDNVSAVLYCPSIIAQPV